MTNNVETCILNKSGINLFWPRRSANLEVIGPPTAAAIAKAAETTPALKYDPVRDCTSKTAPNPYIEIGKRAINPAKTKELAPGKVRITLYFANTPQTLLPPNQQAG